MSFSLLVYSCFTLLCQFLWYNKVNQLYVCIYIFAQPLSHVRIFCTSVDCSLPGSSSLGFHRQECQSGLPFPSPGDLPNPGIKPRSPALPEDSLPLSHQGSAVYKHITPPFWIFSPFRSPESTEQSPLCYTAHF